ncbi:hypothetical protein CGZ75_05910 [Paenibacillus herberti]|uniref:Beta-lactamase-related domain-containing protein n=2 Tax=Paenibacillus herberti TaxID=1619309 RepID=A0A229P6L5_9BACL|nr:hypothetical protein CGZ75_05910 [Paenibacillus herberti]
MKRFCKLILAAALLVVGASLFEAQSPAAAEPSVSALTANTKTTAADLNDEAQLTAFVDGMMNVQMDNLKIPGAVISIVKDGKIVLAKGYGHANIAEGKSVDPATSLFRIASTTKLFTWTAVMQLVEQGKLDLDTDVNTYLKSLQIPNTYPQPITMRQLMTHTAGFEEGGVGYQITTDPKKLPISIADTLAKHIPARVRPPGEMASYSNYGASLAGLIVEEVSGIPYDDYIEQNIFAPLDMKNATVQEPIPMTMVPGVVQGYSMENGIFTAKPLTFEGGFRPAGSGTVSAVDMAHFMVAHLQQGRYGEKQLLQPDTTRLMHAPAFQFHKRMPALDLGFEELRINGVRVISHGGADTVFNTGLYLVPDKKVGVFVSYSGGDGGAAASGLMKAFFNRYFPVKEVLSPPVSAELASSVKKYAGSYQFTRRNHSDIDKFFSFMVQINVKAVDNQLIIGSGAEQQVFVPIEPDLFQQVGGSGEIAFRSDESGKPTHMVFDFLASMPLERTPLFDGTNFWFLLLGISAFVFITVLIGFICRRREIKLMPTVQKWAIRLSVTTAAWALATPVATVVIVLNMDLLERLSRISPSLNLYLWMPILLVALTVAMLLVSVIAWRNKYWTILKRIHFTLVALSALAMSSFFYHWNLLGWQFG